MRIAADSLYESILEAQEIWLNSLSDLNTLPEHKFSSKFNRKMEELIRQSRRPRWANNILFYCKRVAIIIFVLFTVTFSGMMTVNAYREMFINTIIEIYSNLTSFKLNSHNTSDFPVGNFEFSYFPDEDYEQEIIVQSDSIYSLQYQAKYSDHFIYVCQGKISEENQMSIYLDSENAQTKYISVNEYDALLICKNEETFIQWVTDYYVFQLRSNLSEDEVCKIAEGIFVNIG